MVATGAPMDFSSCDFEVERPDLKDLALMEPVLESIDYLRFGFSFVRKKDPSGDIAVSWSSGPSVTRPCSSFLSSIGAHSDILGTGLPCSVQCPVTAPPGWL